MYLTQTWIIYPLQTKNATDSRFRIYVYIYIALLKQNRCVISICGKTNKKKALPPQQVLQ